MRTQLGYATSVLVALIALCFGQLVGFAAPADASDAAAKVSLLDPISHQVALGGSIPLQASVRDTSFGCLGATLCDTPTGTVEFYLEGGGHYQKLASLPLTPVAHIHALAETTTVTVKVTLPAADDYTLTAHYLGDATFGPHHVQTGFTVTKGSLKATLQQSSVTSNKGDSVSFATILRRSTSGPWPTGTVRFFDNGHLIGTGNLILPVIGLSPRASVQTSTLTPGAHTITATYSGDANYTSVSPSAIDHTVNLSIPSLNPCVLITCTASGPVTSGSAAPPDTSCTGTGSQGHAAGDCGVGTVPPSSGPVSTAGGTAAGSSGGAAGGGGAAPGGAAGAPGDGPGDGVAGDAGSAPDGPGATAGSAGGTAVLAAGTNAAGSAAAGPVDPQATGGSHLSLWLAIGIVIALAIAAALFLIARRHRTRESW